MPNIAGSLGILKDLAILGIADFKRLLNPLEYFPSSLVGRYCNTYKPLVIAIPYNRILAY